MTQVAQAPSSWSPPALLSLLAALSLPLGAAAQSASTSAIRGTVRTADGAAVVGAEVQLTLESTGRALRTADRR
ncbi:MAG: hypothetical protein IIB36_06585 [Gemmatimonadetes bacterium]|nr:hypothetical protein [Gemmatimonadota bacterium]